MAGNKFLMLLLASLLSAHALADTADCELCATTEGGVVKGIEEGKVVAFKSIPYAAPPVGGLRFKAPQPAVSWQGEYDASSFRAVCPQVKDPLESYPYAGRPVKVSEFTGVAEVYENEDCLNLSVWTPAVDGKKRPVMVFIPGGAFVVGNGASEYYTGKHLAERDVVVVTLNYRLGVFGFMELGGLDDHYKGSGNNGLRDQIAAINWVKRNAHAFGGDADQITVFGESAGSISVAALLSTKEPQKLFKRAIGQSGGAHLIHDEGVTHDIANDILSINDLKSIEPLTTASPLELLQWQTVASEKGEHGDTMFAPYYDKDVIVGEPNELIKAGNAKGIDLMLGATQNEMNYWSLYDKQLRNPFTSDTDLGPAQPIVPWYLRVFLNLKSLPQSVDGFYSSAMNTEDLEAVRQAQNDDLAMIISMTRLAEMQLQHNPNTYLYRFRWKVPASYSEGGAQLGSVHALELPFMFGTMDMDWIPGGEAVRKAQRPQDIKLSQQMMDAWTNFAKTGNPNSERVPQWPRYDLDARSTMVWSEASATESDPDSERRKHWDFFPFGLYPAGL